MDRDLLLSPIVIIAGYLLGSISWAYVIGRAARGIDMREVGNGRIGTSFAIQRLGLKWGLAVAVLDFLKGSLPVSLGIILGIPGQAVLLTGLAAVAGHNWSVFLGFKGGRGAATTFGVLGVLAPLSVIVSIALMAAPFLLTRRMPFILGIRRTTLLFAVFLGLVSVVVWLQTQALSTAPAPWTDERWPGLVLLPACMLLLNVAGRPEARGAV